MKPNRRFEWNEGPDDRLRALLREWRAPEPPRQLERALAWRLRRRNAWKRGAPWLAAAACLALVLLGRLASTPPAAPPAGRQARDTEASTRASARPPARAASERSPSPAPPSESAAARSPAITGAAAGSSPRPSARRPAAAAGSVEDAVLVEPGQAALLAELARDLRGAKQSPPGAPLPPIEVIPAHAAPPVEPSAEAELQPYQMRWESVGSEWPSMRRAF
jgi:hypothetical protein